MLNKSFYLLTLWVVEKILVHWAVQLHAVGSLPVHNLIDQSDQFPQYVMMLFIVNMTFELQLLESVWKPQKDIGGTERIFLFLIHIHDVA